MNHAPAPCFTKERPSTYPAMLEMAKIGNKALKAVHGKEYKVRSVLGINMENVKNFTQISRFVN